MKKQITAIMDKILSKGMAIMESEKAQQILSSPQAQKAMDLGLAALTKVQAIKECAKQRIADNLGLATKKDLDDLRESLCGKGDADCCCDGACCCDDKKDDDAKADAEA